MTQEPQKPTESTLPLEEQMDLVAEFIQKIVRASEGLPPKEPQIQNFIKLDELKERTIINKRRADKHGYQEAVYADADEILSHRYPEWTQTQRDANNPYILFKFAVYVEDTYGAAIDGRNKDYAVAMEKAKNQINYIDQAINSVPQANQKKPGFFARHFGKGNKEKPPSDSQVQ
jgi:hypothetical protein